MQPGTVIVQFGTLISSGLFRRAWQEASARVFMPEESDPVGVSGGCWGNIWFRLKTVLYASAGLCYCPISSAVRISPLREGNLPAGTTYGGLYMSESNENSREALVWAALKTVSFPGMSRDIVSFGFVRDVQVKDSENGAKAVVQLRVNSNNPGVGDTIRVAAEKAVAELEEIQSVEVRMEVVAPERPEAAQQKAIAADASLLPEVRHVVAVASGKGGVGKSTVASNLAVRLAQMGNSVGLMDADIYGPSAPLMFGIDARPRVLDEKLLPFEKYGVKVMSLGFVLDVDTPVIWRGPMVMKAIEQLLGDVEWGELDYLIVDLPPGTGDAQLTLTQKVPLSGVVIVSTPQDVALIDARKGLAMFRKVNVPIIGIIENMSGFACPKCGEVSYIFKQDGAKHTAEVLDCRFLGGIPLDPAIVRGGDQGIPVVAADPEGEHAGAFGKIAEAVMEEVASSKLERPGFQIL